MTTTTYIDWLVKQTAHDLRAELLAKSRIYHYLARLSDHRATDAAWERMELAKDECKSRKIDPEPIVAEGKRTHTAGITSNFHQTRKT